MYNFYLSKKRPFNDGIDVKIVTLLGFLNSVCVITCFIAQRGYFLPPLLITMWLSLAQRSLLYSLTSVGID